MQKTLGAAIVVLVLVACAAVAAQENPLIGSWKFNPSKSNLTGETVVIRQVGADEMEMAAAGQSYRFKLDGKEVPAIFGYAAAWTKIDDNTWQAVMKVNDKVVSTDTYRLSPDGSKLTLTMKGTKPNGDPFEETQAFRRSKSAAVPTGTSGATGGGTAGLAGEWKSSDFKTNAPSTLKFEANGDDGLTMTLVEWGSTASAKFDGKDYPATGPTLPAGFTLSMTKKSPRAVEVTFKQDGKPVMTTVYTASADGKTLTAVGRAAGEKQSTTTVFDRQ